jgi:hypothetical protein
VIIGTGPFKISPGMLGFKCKECIPVADNVVPFFVLRIITLAAFARFIQRAMA